MLIGQLRIGDFFIADPNLHQDPAFPHCCLSKWSLQESFAFVPSSQMAEMFARFIFQNRLDIYFFFAVFYTFLLFLFFSFVAIL